MSDLFNQNIPNLADLVRFAEPNAHKSLLMPSDDVMDLQINFLVYDVRPEEVLKIVEEAERAITEKGKTVTGDAALYIREPTSPGPVPKSNL